MHLVWGSAGVSPVVFGVPPKTFARPRHARFSDTFDAPRDRRETPTVATATVALPRLNCRLETQEARLPGPLALHGCVFSIRDGSRRTPCPDRY